MIGPCYALLSGLSLSQSSGRGRIAGCFTLIVFLLALFLGFWCSVSLPRGVVDWAAVCKFCGISGSYLFILRYITHDCFFSFLFHLPNYSNHYS